jgi:hypothetical protein
MWSKSKQQTKLCCQENIYTRGIETPAQPPKRKKTRKRGKKKKRRDETQKKVRTATMV